MRIVHVYKDYFPVLGGIENHVRVLAENQAAAGHDVTVLVCASGLRSGRRLESGVFGTSLKFQWIALRLRSGFFAFP